MVKWTEVYTAKNYPFLANRLNDNAYIIMQSSVLSKYDKTLTNNIEEVLEHILLPEWAFDRGNKPKIYQYDKDGIFEVMYELDMSDGGVMRVRWHFISKDIKGLLILYGKAK